MTPRPLPRRALLATVALTVAASAVPLTAAASAPPDAPAPSGDSAPAAAFPVTIATKYGDVTIEEEPQRVVSIGFTDQDALWALGVEPVGVREWYGGQEYAAWPWALDALGDSTPTVLSATEENFEAIAALEPDVIIGVSSGITEEQFETLNRIAPTVTQSGDFIDFGMPWREGFRMIATAVGRAPEAEAIIADIEAEFAAIREAHPEFAGATAAVSFLFDDQPGAYASADSRSQLLIELGFEIPEVYDELAGDLFYASFSAEEIAYLDVDALVWVASDAATLQAVEDFPTRELLDAHDEGREVILGVELSGAFSFNSPLSIPFLLDDFVPMLAAAVDGDPATEIPG